MRRIPCEQCTRTSHTIGLDEFHTCGVTGLYKARQVVFHEGTRADGFFILCQGAAGRALAAFG